jgi:TPR repeat protein
MSFSNILNRSKQALLTKLTPPATPEPTTTTINKRPSNMLLSANNKTTTTTTTTTALDERGQHYFEKGNNFLFGKDGCPNDPITAVYYFKKAISLYHHTASQGVLGFCFEFGLGVPQDFIQAEKHYLAASSGNSLSMARLAFLRKYGRPGVKIDRVEAEVWASQVLEVDWIVRAATYDSCAQYALGVCYHDGVGLAKDEKLAVYWYTKSAEQNNARGQGILGYCYGEGFGVEKSEKLAMKYYRLAAAQGETVAIYNIGYCFEDGIGVEKDVVEAVKWYTLSAEQGNAFAQNSLGYCFEDGIGVQQDFKRATYWYKQSASQGYPWAQCNLGYCTFNT